MLEHELQRLKQNNVAVSPTTQEQTNSLSNPTNSTVYHHQVNQFPAPNGQLSTAPNPNINNSANSQNNQAHAYFQQQYHNTMQTSTQSYAASTTQHASPNQSPLQQPTKQGFEGILVKFVLPTVFVCVLLVGILLVFTAGVALGIITEPMRFALGVFLALVLYGVGILLYNKNMKVLGLSLLGGGHGTFIIAISVAHLSYQLIGTYIAALLFLLSSGLVLISAWKWRSELLVSIVIITGYLCIFLLDAQNISSIFFISIQFVLSVSMMFISRLLNYRIAHILAYSILHLSLMISYSVHYPVTGSFVLLVLLLQLLFIFIPYIRHQAIQIELNTLQVISTISIVLWAIFLLAENDISSLLFLSVLGMLTLAYSATIVWFEYKSNHLSNDPSYTYNTTIQLSALISSFTLLCFFLELLGSSYFDILLYLIGFALILYGIRSQFSILLYSGFILSFFGTTAIMFEDAEKILSYEVLCWFAVVIGIGFLYYEFRQLSDENHNQHAFETAFSWIWAFIGFWILTKFAVLIGEQFASDEVKPYFVSFSWLLYAIGGITLGVIRNLSGARLTGILLLLVLVVKVIFIDITFLNMIIKSILFLTLGTVGILVSYLLYHRVNK